MYDDEYGDEMEYGEDMSEDDENVSDDDEELGEMGHIEGLPGDPNVVEVIMGEGEDDDDDDDDEDDMEEDEPSDDDDGDDDDIGSEDMEDVEEQIEIFDEEGNPLADDGGSGWESESGGEDDDDEEEIDYEADAQDLDEHNMDEQIGRFGNIMRAAIDPDNVGPIPDFGEPYIDDNEEDGTSRSSLISASKANLALL